MVFFDSESMVKDNIHYPYLICAEFHKNGKHVEKEYTKNLKEFWFDVISFTPKKGRTFVFAHNAGYDVLVTKAIPTIVGAGFTVTKSYEQGMTFILDFVKKDENDEKEKTISVISSSNYFSFSLAAIGKMFGIEKGEYDFNLGLSPEAIAYCKQDVKICRTAILSFIKFLQDNDLGGFSSTIAGQAFKAFKTRFMNTDIYIHKDERATRIERAAYYGGRTECFRIGRIEENVYSYDINSMYPDVMFNEKYPVKLVSKRKKCSLENLQELLDRGYLLCAKVNLKTDSPIYPKKLAGQLLFPIGNFSTYLCTPEIVVAIENNHLISVEECSIYESDNIFKGYVDFFYTERLKAKEKGDKVADTMYKLFLNSLYGKFGQKGNFWEKIGEADPKDIQTSSELNADTGERSQIKIFGGSIFRKTNIETEAVDSFCAISAHVTSYARVKLNKFISIAGTKNVIYTDTDSLFTNIDGKENLSSAGCLDDKKLGMLKYVCDDTNLLVFSPKDYVFSGEVKHKGIKKSATKIGKNTYSQEQWLRLTTAVNERNLHIYMTKNVIKELKREYNKGVLEKKSTLVYPIRLNGDTIVPYGFESPHFKKYYKHYI